MIYMVRYRHFGVAQIGVEATSKEEAMRKFNAWRERLANKEDYSEAINSYELRVIK